MARGRRHLTPPLMNFPPAKKHHGLNRVAGIRRRFASRIRSCGRDIPVRIVPINLCFPKIISERNGGAAQTRLGWLQWPRSAGLSDLVARLCPAPSACGPHCSRPHKKKEFVAGAPRRKSAPGPGTRDARYQSDALHRDFAKATAGEIGRSRMPMARTRDLKACP